MIGIWNDLCDLDLGPWPTLGFIPFTTGLWRWLPTLPCQLELPQEDSSAAIKSSAVWFLQYIGYHGQSYLGLIVHNYKRSTTDQGPCKHHC